MKVLLDEMLTPAIARALRARGHDIQAIKEHAEGLSDADVVALARREHRAIVTTNVRDFRPIHNELLMPGGGGHWGFVFVPAAYHLTKAALGQIIAALEAQIVAYPNEQDLADGETWI